MCSHIYYYFFATRCTFTPTAYNQALENFSYDEDKMLGTLLTAGFE